MVGSSRIAAAVVVVVDRVVVRTSLETAVAGDSIDSLSVALHDGLLAWY